MSEGVQITIPDFDDDDNFNSTPVFGRTNAGGFWGAAQSGFDSPTTSTPVIDRDDRGFFHARGDSVASEDSSHSVHTSTRKFKAPFAHSAQSSVATTNSSPFTKKPSFASLRNAFKSAKSSDVAPPLPTINHEAYPVLKNPFNRSTSSLAHHAHGRPSIHTSPSQMRPATPASSDMRSRSKSKSHTPAKSQHSHSGSIFHSSDAGSDFGGGASYMPSFSPPPVPRVPSALGAMSSREDLDLDDKIVVEARTPSDFALHAIFIRFAARAEDLVEQFVSQPLDRDPHLENFMGSGVDLKFDELLRSLGKVAQKHAKPVVDSLLRWRKSQKDGSYSDLQHIYSRNTKVGRINDVSSVIHERRLQASIYITCRALVTATQSFSRDSLSDTLGNQLEELTFAQFRNPDVKMLMLSPNHRANSDLYAIVLGNLALHRFESVTDRFRVELGPVAAGQVPKDLDSKYEYLVKGLQHVQIKVYPPEAFEEGAEFLDSLSKSFEHAHGSRLKRAFAEVLVQMLYDIAKTAQAEVNHPQWAKAIEIIYPKARDMANKPRYWDVAYPLAVISLCVAPREYFLRHWQGFVDASLNKLKASAEKPVRIPIMNGVLRLCWTYLYRCHEPASTIQMKIDPLLEHFFPPKRLTVLPQDDRHELLVYLIHFILGRSFDYGSEKCLELLQERAISSSQSSNVTSYLAPDRMSIALQAILLSVRLFDGDDPIPSWPSSPDFMVIPDSLDYPSSSNIIPPGFLKPNWTDFLDRVSAVVCAVAASCYQYVGKMSMLDDQWSAVRLNPSYEETHNYIIRRHDEGSMAYPVHFVSQINVLVLCYRSWPRCLHSSLSLDSALEMLIRGVIHVEPAVCDTAFLALERFTADFKYNCALLSQLMTMLFDPRSVASDGSVLRLMTESSRMTKLWGRAVQKWADHIKERTRDSFAEAEMELIALNIAELEAAALFMLSHVNWAVCNAGTKTIRLIEAVRKHVPNVAADESSAPASVLLGSLPKSLLDGNDDLLDDAELARLRKWRDSEREHVFLNMAERDDKEDRALWWKHTYPSVIQTLSDQRSDAIAALREKLISAVLRYHPFIAQVSGVTGRAPGVPRSASIGNRETSKVFMDNKFAVQQWYIWTRLLCITAPVSDSRGASSPSSRSHTRVRSESNVERESLTTSRDLFKYLAPFLDSDISLFQQAAVAGISSLPAYGYSQLLEDLSTLASRQLYDDVRSKGSIPNLGRIRRPERLYTAVARIYFLTAQNMQKQRSSGKQTALTHIIKYIRNMQTFLSSYENRDVYSLQRLRRYFCGVVERFFDGLAVLADTDRFVPSGMYPSLYRLCEEWCQLGKQSDDVKQRLIFMQTAASRSITNPAEQADWIQKFQIETKSLSNAAAGAMASLIPKAYFTPEVSASGSPTEKATLEQSKPLEAAQILDRLVAFLASFMDPVRDHGKRGLKSLLANKRYDVVFADEVMRRAFVVTRESNTSNALFFEAVADVIRTGEHGFSPSQIVCLGLSNLSHPDQTVRRRAYDMLEVIHEQYDRLRSIAHYEPFVASHAPSAYLEAHRAISDALSQSHSYQAVNVMQQFSLWIPRIYDALEDVGRTLILLQSLEYWVPYIELMIPDRSELTRDGSVAMYNLISLTARYAQKYPGQITALWSRLVEARDHWNCHAVIRFLLEQSQKVGSTAFVSCAAKIVACLSASEEGDIVLRGLCDIIIPAAMLPALDHKLGMPEEEDVELWSDLDILFPDQPRITLGLAQFALLFLSEGAMAYCAELQDRLPVLLHILLLHLDHRLQFVQQSCRNMLSELLRSWISKYDKLHDRSAYASRAELRAAITKIEDCISDSTIWKTDDPNSEVQRLCSQLLEILGPLVPDLEDTWGAVALDWATSCHFRPIACHSLQLYRSLSPTPSQNNLDALLVRLSNIVADEDPGMHPFTTELLATLTTMASAEDLNIVLVPQIFWCAVACLSTTSETEFQHVLELLHALLSRLDLDDQGTTEALLSERPPSWHEPASLQAPLLTGLRSSKTSQSTFKLLQRLANVADGCIIDASEGRLRDLYTAVLPWCLHAMANDISDEALQDFALDIGYLAEQEERGSITRIMTSFAKNRFRTKEDFLRESVASLREHYGMDHWSDVVTLLVGLVLNNEKWLRVHTLQILKVLFQQRETKSSVDVMGSELLMPLLRLLETDLAQEALEVLEEPMRISGGPAAKHVLRMSLHNHLTANVKEVESVAEIFGIAEESGWCVPRSAARRECCRMNVGAVCDLHKAPLRPSQITFHEEDMLALSEMHRLEEDDLGDLVQNLHELSSFFQDDTHGLVVPNRQLEARVAAILAKSTDSSADAPATPFGDVFDVITSGSSDLSDDDYPSDVESDLFEYDLGN
ncbi:uncharacterized protein PHACADRAFT_172641 [Phanerochaete carnosa HHB-10118-sp]|uniref:Cell morphogenesis protein N-terminal domain-containing protein n=1 Tax=Phanerochaete carnosa (strain HHB-10118-sp) TaxID=650164 RepID=K5V308_PHACS|nr:uncharacterized protein PHACADRAFT_172641 [Phanerochaete carnosa HHB-10118-sp]EKM56941.1 hypothetical protein PHACADRAFT_172641 [Phanerochaete carnosa HHB-10118-sp]